MCTAITYRTKDHYFGRNLDYEHGFQESVVITPRDYPFSFRRMAPMEQHYAMIGMAIVSGGYPLYFDATNEHGLSMAGLNFPLSAKYMTEVTGKDNVTPFELIPWLLGSCKSVMEAMDKLNNANLVNIPFSPEYPLSPLHWIMADEAQTVVIEQTEAGLQVYDNPVGVLTNEPPFPFHMTNLQNYLHISNQDPHNHFAPELPLKVYSRGMGGLGLPGDLSSASRFVKAAFTRLHSLSKDSESTSISQVSTKRPSTPAAATQEKASTITPLTKTVRSLVFDFMASTWTQQNLYVIPWSPVSRSAWRTKKVLWQDRHST